MSMVLAHDDGRLRWPGAVSLQRTDGWTMPWRLPYEARGLFPPDELRAKAGDPAGVRIAMRTDAETIAGTVVPHPEATQIDLCFDGECRGSVDLAGADRFRFEGLPAGEKAVELWLPQFGSFRLRSLEVSDGARVEPLEDDRPRWTVYGSSIAQCRAAASPTQTWPAIVARGRGLDLTCLGFGGQCHLDPMIVRLMRDLPADVITLCLGINIYGAASLSPRSFRPAVIGAVRTIREKHPDIPVVLMSPVLSCERETTPNAVGFTIPMMREEIVAAIEALRAQGDGNLHYVNGLDILGPDDAHLLPDNLHPDAEGYRLMGQRFLEKVIPTVFP